jgi:photosystem II stability/assembly factor-like uncharacterized protein
MLLVLFSLSISAHRSPYGLNSNQGGEEILYQQDFNSGEAPGWNLEPGWQVAPSEGGYAMRGNGHVWARYSEIAWEDAFLRFRVKLESGAALHANIRVDEVLRYFIGIQAQQMYLSRQTGANSFNHNLALAAGIGSGWHTVEISAVKGEVKVLVDKVQRLIYTDPAPLRSGRIAFESLENASVWVDDIQVGIPAAAAQPTPLGTAASQPANLKWEITSGPLGGLGYDVRMRPDQPDTLFVTDAKAGVFRSLDGGKSWQAANTGITVRTGETNELIPIFCLTVDPLNPNIAWAGTQFQRGAFKTTDGGNTWKKMDSGITEQSLTLRGFTVDPRSSDTVYAAGEISSWEWNGNPLNGIEFDLTRGVIYKTTNGGASWKRIWSGDNLARYIWIDSRDPNVLYASTGIFDREAANSDPKTRKAGGVGVLKSTDGGTTWKPVNQGLNNLYVGSLFMHPQNPDILLAGTGNVTYDANSGVYLSSDGGATWQQTLKEYVIAAVEFAASNPNIAYAANINSVYRSDDGGKSWREVSGGSEVWGPNGISGGTPIDIQVDPRNPDRLFINAYGGGNFLSLDGGKTWSDASKDYTGAMVRDIAVDPASPSRVFALGRSGIFLTTNSGADWLGIAYQPAKELDWHAVAMNPQDANLLLAELTCSRRLVRSIDGGKSWKVVNQAPPNVAWRSIEFAPSDPRIVYAGSTGYYSCGSFDHTKPGKGIQVSADHGQTWKDANDGGTQDASISQLAVHPKNPLIVYAATYNKGLLKTSDGGKSWTPVKPAASPNIFSAAPLSAVRISPLNPNLVFAGRMGGGLVRSEDGGTTWTTSASGLNPQATVSDLEFDLSDPRVIYLADLFSGVFRSGDAGKTWKAVNQNLLLRAVNALALSGDGQHLYAATEGRGVFRLDLNGKPPVPLQQPTATRLPAAVSPQPLPAASQIVPAPSQPVPAASLPASPTRQPASPPEPTARNPLLPPVCSSAIPVLGVLAWAVWNQKHEKKEKL